ncbi:MAG: hypothetical protein K1X89_04425 [Myxococcaceae bacterium]|nr:hypothetical protein [Myxococcaceae bacterium]
MHPVLARYMNAQQLLESLARHGRGEKAQDEVEAALFAEASAHPEVGASLGKKSSKTSDEASAEVLKLASNAAVRALSQDAALGPLVEAGRAAMRQEGASDEETQLLLAMVLLEEGFGTDEDVDDFDADFVAETLTSIPALAKVDEAKVEALEEAFVAKGPKDARALRSAVAEALMGAAWSEGVGPVSAEHVAEAGDALLADAPELELVPRLEGILAMIEFLAAEGLVGPLRLERLLDAAHAAAAAAQGGEDDAEETLDDDEEFSDDDEDEGGGSSSPLN